MSDERELWQWNVESQKSRFDNRHAEMFPPRRSEIELNNALAHSFGHACIQ